MTLSDLNPDALAELEAKLARDLEMVRRVRALLIEHQSAAPSAPSPATTAAPPPTPAPPAPPLPRAPARPIEDVLQEALATLPGQGFHMEDLKWACHRVTRVLPDTSTVKAFLKQAIRKGHVTLVDVRSGRRGSRYRHSLSRPDSVETPPEDADSPAE